MDWERTYNPYHPFESYLLYPRQSPPCRPIKPKWTAENPSPYWLEQAPFYEPPTRSDPFTRPEELPAPSCIEIACNTACYLLSPIISSIVTTTTTITNAVAILITILLAIIKLTIHWTVVAPWEAWRRFCEEIGFVGLVACCVAICVVPLLPSWGRTAVQVVREPEPLYVIFVAGRDAIGRGPVVTSGQF
ncbi:hypothetical protein ONS95_010443 [Cadophora gregata]|uniref:uncharacterized protein n=1 Tax=Cadophora gregata TaxID=51156 RepID=UPI0026DB9FBB|nr:uncharacterized protein ONS95_010443 [Cadophora gregata]KAK0122185.1 hypothetical protein ONS95_010443 [Cadophora gregata]